MSNQPISARTLALAALDILRGYVEARVHESGGNNMGAQVQKFQQARGGEPGESWCLDCQEFCYLKALANLLKKPYTADTIVSVCRGLRATLQQYFDVTGSCGELMRDAQKRKMWVDRNDLTEIQPGWLVLYAFSSSAVTNRVPAHVGMCEVAWSKSTQPITSLEGNTGLHSQTDGDGCARKYRSFANVVGVVKTY